MRFNPYIVGNPIGEEKEFYGRTDIFKIVSRMLRNTRENAIVLYGQRRIGKTSVLMQLERQLNVAAEFIPIYFDLMHWTGKPLADLLFDLAQRMNFALQLPSPDRANFDAHGDYFRQTLLPQATATAAPKGLVFLFDEFDVLATPQQNQADEAFFPYLSQLLHKDSQIQFVFVIGRRPEDLSSRTIGAFRTVKSAQVALMSQRDSMDIIRQSEENDSLRWPDAAAKAVWKETRGHPYFTQLIASAVWDLAQQDEPQKTPAVTPEMVTAVRDDALITGANAFAWLWDGMPPAERIIMAAIAEAEQETLSVDDVVDILNDRGVQMFVGELKLAPKTLVDWGVLQQTDGGYRVAVSLLRYWVQKNKPLRLTKDEIDNIHPLAMQLFNAGQGYLNQENFVNAEDQFRRALEVNPNHFQAKASLGRVLLEQDKTEEAAQVLEEAYASDPSSATRTNLVRALLTLAERQTTEEQQLALYERTLAVLPTHSAARAGKQAIETARQKREQERLAEHAKTHEDNEAWAEALAIYREILHIHPDNEQWQTRLKNAETQAVLKQKYDGALKAFDADDLKTAQQLLLDVIKQQPDYKEALNHLLRATNKVDVTALQKERDSQRGHIAELEKSAAVAETKIAGLQDQIVSRGRLLLAAGAIFMLAVSLTAFFVVRGIRSTSEDAVATADTKTTVVAATVQSQGATATAQEIALVTVIALAQATDTPTPLPSLPPSPTATPSPTNTPSPTPSPMPTPTPTNVPFDFSAYHQADQSLVIPAVPLAAEAVWLINPENALAEPPLTGEMWAPVLSSGSGIAYYYMENVTGDLPISVTWALDHGLNAGLYQLYVLDTLAFTVGRQVFTVTLDDEPASPFRGQSTIIFNDWILGQQTNDWLPLGSYEVAQGQTLGVRTEVAPRAAPFAVTPLLIAKVSGDQRAMIEALPQSRTLVSLLDDERAEFGTHIGEGVYIQSTRFQEVITDTLAWNGNYIDRAFEPGFTDLAVRIDWLAAGRLPPGEYELYVWIPREHATVLADYTLLANGEPLDTHEMRQSEWAAREELGEHWVSQGIWTIAEETAIGVRLSVSSQKQTEPGEIGVDAVALVRIED